MIIVPERQGDNCIIKVLIGPESEGFLDLNAYLGVDISELFEDIGENDKVSILIMHVGSEVRASQSLKTMEIGHKSVIPVMMPKDSKSSEEPFQQPVKHGKTVKRVDKKGTSTVDKCSYCGVVTELVPAAKKICKSCLDIELGLRK